MALTPEERATTINYDASNDEAEMVTWDRSEMTKMSKNPDVRLIEEMNCQGTKGAVYRFPKKLVNVRKARRGTGPRITNPMVARERMAQARAAKG